jgi:hypothetical protein
MSFTAAVVERFIVAGGKLSIDSDGGYTSAHLERFVRLAKANNVPITLRNASTKTNETIEMLIDINADLIIEI